MRKPPFIAILLLTAALSAASATTLLPIRDTVLADQAAVIAVGTVIGSGPSARAGWPAVEYRLRVERLVKGDIAAGTAGTLTVRVPGGAAEGGLKLKVWGAPELRIGERVLLFLEPRPDGTYGVMHLTLGAFHELRSEGRRLAVRDLSEVFAAGESGAGEGIRDLDRFARWLGDRAAGLEREADYLVPAPRIDRALEEFTYIGGVKQRWPDFDLKRDVTWYAHQSGQPGLPGGGFGEIKSALQAWNADPATNIRYRYQGTTGTTSGFKLFDGVNAVLFEDPNGEAPGSFSCPRPGQGEGVLAIGGTWYNDSKVPAEIQGADIIVNDGAGCWFTTSKRAEQIFGHELGHTLGLGHSCGDGRSGSCSDPTKNEALMRATAHSDERGAQLQADDLAGILSLYADPNAPAGPAAPSQLTAVAVSSTQVQLAWADNSTDETGFRIERKTTGAFQEVLAVGADTAAAVISGLQPGTSYTFRVRARNASGFSAYSNNAAVKTPAGATPPAAPSGLSAAADSTTSIRLTWSDKSSNETDFLIEASSPAAGFTQMATAPADATSATVGGLAANTPYTFRIRARNAAGMSAFSSLASASTPGAGGPCVAGAETLCLAGGRFRVQARWRIGTDNGAGWAVPVGGSDRTGMFWFFAADNIELIVKILDGTPINGASWTFYGALSDVDYWVTVTDTQTGVSKTYYNPKGNLCGVGDVNSLPASGAVSAAPATAPAPVSAPATACGPGKLCLLGGRFEVEVSWELRDGTRGVGTPVALSDQSGLFWFFDQANIELVVKTLDGQPVNGKFWFFYGALSDVQYRIEVTDTLTGARKTYANPAGNLCGLGDTSAF